MMPSYGVKLHRIVTEEADPSRTVGNVVFVHGLGGGPFETWGSAARDRADEGCWPTWIAEDFPKLAVYALDYEAPKFKRHVEAEQILRRDRTILECLLEEDALASAPTAFICHSLGGLMIKSMALLASEERHRDRRTERLFAHMAQVIFLGTPHLGADLAQVVRASRWFGVRPSVLVDDLANKAHLERLNERYVNMPRLTRKEIQHLVFRETEKTGGMFRTMVVPPHSADPKIPGVEPIDVQGSDHFDIAKPRDRKLPVDVVTTSFYTKICELLRTLPNAVPYIPDHWPRGLRIGSNEIHNFVAHYMDDVVPFSGRERELAHLDQWLNDPKAEPTLLLSAPAGRGKSSLIVRWIDSLRNGGRVLAPGERKRYWHKNHDWRLIFVPISIRFGSNAPRDYLRFLTNQLGILAGEHMLNQDAAADFYRECARGLLERLAGTGQRILLIFDGLDEAIEPETLKGLLPLPLAGNIRVLASARWPKDETNGGGWLAALGWDSQPRPPGQDCVVERLDAAAIRLALRHLGESELSLRRLHENGPLVTRISELTEGEPLLLRLYVEDMRGLAARRQPITLEHFDAHMPGFAAYFRHELNAYRERVVAQGFAEVDERTIDPTIALIATAKAPLPGSELRNTAIAGFSDASPPQRWEIDVRQHVEPLRRFLIARDNQPVEPYALIHPKLAHHILEDYCPELAELATNAFCRRGAQHARNLESGAITFAQASPYVLQYYAEHLEAAKRPAIEFMAMVEDGWRRAKEALDGGPGGFAENVKAAWKLANVRSSLPTSAHNVGA
jgi:hypothetical protein